MSLSKFITLPSDIIINTRFLVLENIVCIEKNVHLDGILRYTVRLESPTISFVLEEEDRVALSKTLGYDIIQECIAEKRKIVCICGSTHYSFEFQEAKTREELSGNIVLSIDYYTKNDLYMFSNDEFEQERQKLEELHLRKIELADEVFVLNVHRYIGKRTAQEILYAHKLKKLIRWFEAPWFDISDLTGTIALQTIADGEEK